MAVGGIGMSVGDFCGLTPEELGAIIKAWQQQNDRAAQEQWERTRWECLYAVQPHSTKNLRPEDVMKFPWDDKPTAEKTPEDPAERRKKFEAAKKRFGLK